MSAQGEDILAWLDGAISEREQIAFNALNHERGATWEANGSTVQVVSGLATFGDVFKETVVFNEGSPTEEQAEHIALNDPASVLRRCAADRKLLELHQAVPDHGRYSEALCPPDCAGEHSGPLVCVSCRDYVGDPVDAPCPTAVAIAEGYGWTGDKR